MIQRFQFVLAVIVCLTLASTVQAQTDQLQTNRQQNYQTEATRKPVGVGVGVGEFEIVWKSLATHQQASLSVCGFDSDTNITQTFVDGEESFFNPIEAGLAAGRYCYQIEFIPNETLETATRIRSASTLRRELLAQRLELLKAGDRQGAKRLLLQANEIRQSFVDQPVSNETIEKHIRDRGILIVKEDGSIEKYDINVVEESAHQEHMEEEAKNRREMELEKNRGNS